MNPKVSIIVPVYNAESVLNRCINSILKQEYTDFELLLVDDGSTDGSPQLCDQFAREDERVRVIHKENGGVSSARNIALSEAKGTYLQFLDSDDWITPNATSLLVREAEEHHCDMVIADFYRVVGKRVSAKGSISEDTVLTREQFAAHMMKSPADFYYGVLWNKLYRRSIVEKHKLRMNEELNWCEDFLFNLEYIRYAETFCALPVPIYYYVKTKGSLATRSMSLARIIKMKLTLFEYYHRLYQEVFDEEEYERRKLQVYRFLIDAADDDGVAPTILPGSTRLGKERLTIDPDSLDGSGSCMDAFRGRKLLEYYLEPVAKKFDLSMPEALLLYQLMQINCITTTKRLADITDTPWAALVLQLQKLTMKGYLHTDDLKRDSGASERQILFSFPPEAHPILSELNHIQSKYDQARFADFTEEEIAQYFNLNSRIQQNMRNVLQ
ncbi:MAG: glycosyltransferase [Butyricicoccus sp.]